MSNLTFSTKKQVVYQAEYKKLMFDLYDLGGQYKVYHKIKWYHNDIPYRESWELVAAYRTLGEAKAYMITSEIFRLNGILMNGLN